MLGYELGDPAVECWNFARVIHVVGFEKDIFGYFVVFCGCVVVHFLDGIALERCLSPGKRKRVGGKAIPSTYAQFVLELNTQFMIIIFKRHTNKRPLVL